MSSMDLTPEELTMLATYNSERARGILHSDEWKGYMAALQNKFDHANEAWSVDHGGERRSDGSWIYPNDIIRCGDKKCRCRNWTWRPLFG